MFFSFDLLTNNGKFSLIWNLGNCQDGDKSRVLRKYRRQIILNDLLSANRELRTMLPVQGRSTSTSLRLGTVLLHGIVINLDLKVNSLLKRSTELLKFRANVAIRIDEPEEPDRRKVTLEVNIGDMENIGEMQNIMDVPFDLSPTISGNGRYLLPEADIPEEPFLPDVPIFDFPQATQAEIEAILDESLWQQAIDTGVENPQEPSKLVDIPDEEQQADDNTEHRNLPDSQNVPPVPEIDREIPENVIEEPTPKKQRIETDPPADETSNVMDLPTMQNGSLADLPVDETPSVMDIPTVQNGSDTAEVEDTENPRAAETENQQLLPDQQIVPVIVPPEGTTEMRDIRDILKPPRRKVIRKGKKRLIIDTEKALGRRQLSEQLSNFQDTLRSGDEIVQIKRADKRHGRKFLSAAVKQFLDLELRKEAFFEENEVELQREVAGHESFAQTSKLNVNSRLLDNNETGNSMEQELELTQEQQNLYVIADKSVDKEQEREFQEQEPELTQEQQNLDVIPDKSVDKDKEVIDPDRTAVDDNVSGVFIDQSTDGVERVRTDIQLSPNVQAPLNDMTGADVDNEVIPQPSFFEPVVEPAPVLDQPEEELHEMMEIDQTTLRVGRIRPQDVLDTIHDRSNGAGIIFFHEVCPPNEHTRFEAASTFAAMLRLEQKGYISMEQENCSDSILTHVEQGEDYATSGSNE